MKIAMAITAIAMVMTVAGGMGAAQGITKEITGVAGYTLGAEKKDVLAAHPSLRPADGGFTNATPSSNEYTGVVEIGGMQPADLLLVFWQDRLARIWLNWSESKFPSVEAYRNNVFQLFQVPRMFSPDLIKKNALIDGTLGVALLFILEDADGNELFASASSNCALCIGKLSAMYSWGPYKNRPK